MGIFPTLEAGRQNCIPYVLEFAKEGKTSVCCTIPVDEEGNVDMDMQTRVMLLAVKATRTMNPAQDRAPIIGMGENDSFDSNSRFEFSLPKTVPSNQNAKFKNVP